MEPKRVCKPLPNNLGIDGKVNKQKGALAFTYAGEIAESHKNTLRIVIIGPSNSGKTTMFVNLLKDFPRPIKSISYIAPYSSLHDEGPVKLKNICEKVKMVFSPIQGDGKDGVQLPDNPKPEVVVFDDMYKQKKVEALVDEVFIRGRHDQRHGVYITQSPAYVPSSAKNNYSYLIIHKDFLNNDTELKFHIQKNRLVEAGEINEAEKYGFNFLIMKTGGIIVDWYQPPQWPNTSKVIDTFKSIVGGGKPGVKKVSKKITTEIHDGIRNAGNENVDNKEVIYEKPAILDKNSVLLKNMF